jgi:hypothetical protein
MYKQHTSLSCCKIAWPHRWQVYMYMYDACKKTISYIVLDYAPPAYHAENMCTTYHLSVLGFTVPGYITLIWYFNIVTTIVWVVTTVHSNMANQGTLLREWFHTLTSLVWFITIVHPNMFYQGTLLRKWFHTLISLVWLVTTEYRAMPRLPFWGNVGIHWSHVHGSSPMLYMCSTHQGTIIHLCVHGHVSAGDLYEKTISYTDHMCMVYCHCAREHDKSGYSYQQMSSYTDHTYMVYHHCVP